MERGLERGVASAEQRQPSAQPHEVLQRLEQHVHALLPGQPADHDEQRAPITAHPGIEPELGRQRGAVGFAPGQTIRADRRRDCRLGLRVPLGGVDPVDDPLHGAAPRADQAVQAHAEFGVTDLAGISRADRGDRRGAFQPGLQQANPAVVLDPIHRPRLRRQPELRKHGGGEVALERHVVDRHHCRDPALCRRETQVGGGEAGLPVVSMEQVEPQPFRRAAGDVGGCPAERGEAAPVVRPVTPGIVAIGAPRTVEQVRGIEHQQAISGQQPRRTAEQLGPLVRGAWPPAELAQHVAIAGDQRGHGHTVRRKRARQRAGDVGQSPGLDIGHRLGGDREDRQGHPSSRSIIALLIRHTPLAVRRNRLASSTGSSPTTSPSGMRTPVSRITRDSFALRPMLQ